MRAVIIAAIATVALAAAAEARGGGGHGGGHSSGGSHSVRGHITKTGRYVQPHHATNRDSTKLNNWSTRGNVNPYTGQAGTKSPF